MATRAGKLSLRGRFTPGDTVRLVKVDGPHVMRPGPNDETVDEQRVDKDGTLQFSKGVSVGERYFAVGTVNGQPLEVRLTGRTEDDPGHLAGYEPVSPDRARVGIGGTGGWADEPQPRQDGDEQNCRWADVARAGSGVQGHGPAVRHDPRVGASDLRG
jgi:hypothetical protein